MTRSPKSRTVGRLRGRRGSVRISFRLALTACVPEGQWTLAFGVDLHHHTALRRAGRTSFIAPGIPPFAERFAFRWTSSEEPAMLSLPRKPTSGASLPGRRERSRERSRAVAAAAIRPPHLRRDPPVGAGVRQEGRADPEGRNNAEGAHMVSAESASPDPFQRAWLIVLVRDLLPPGETCMIDSAPLSPTAILYTIHPGSSRGRGILIGRNGETVNALRRIFTIHLSSHRAGWTPTIQIASERTPPSHVELEASTHS